MNMHLLTCNKFACKIILLLVCNNMCALFTLWLVLYPCTYVCLLIVYTVYNTITNQKMYHHLQMNFVVLNCYFAVSLLGHVYIQDQFQKQIDVQAFLYYLQEWECKCLEYQLYNYVYSWLHKTTVQLSLNLTEHACSMILMQYVFFSYTHVQACVYTED